MIATFLRIGGDRASVGLRRLSTRPTWLFLVLLTLNALARPYANFAHDSRLYAVQVLNRVYPGAFADDLFLRYGSQDQYSVFSILAAPLVRGLGLDWSFFALYVVSNGLLIFALLRLVRALVDDSVLSTLALLFLVVAPLPYGGLHVFHVHEPFFTPRIIATALVLLGLERLLRGRAVVALCLIAVAGPVHPLMAFGGFAVWAGCVVVERFGAVKSVVLGTLTTGAALLVLSSSSLGERLLGRMDPDWRRIVRDATPYNFSADWPARDWLDVVVSLGVLLAAVALVRNENPRRARFVGVVAVIGAVGLASTILASTAPYALPFQGQPYRVLWILKAIQAPLAFSIAAGLWRRHSTGGRVLALLLAGYFALTDFVVWELCAPVVFFVVLGVLCRGLGSTPRDRDWLPASLAGGVVLGSLTWSLLKVWVLVREQGALATQWDSLDYARSFSYTIGPTFWLAVALACVGMLSRMGEPLAFVVPALVVLLGLQAAGVLLPQVAGSRAFRGGATADLVLVRQYLDQRRPADGVPTVYGHWGRVDYLWLTLRAKSYFDWTQMLGALFSRPTAIEGRRRALVVGPFEVYRFRGAQRFVPETTRLVMTRFFGERTGGPSPSRADLARLCGPDEPVDIAVLENDFPGLSSATNGRRLVYDCRRVREVLARSGGND